MNHREPPHLPAAVRRALHCLSLLLLPALAPKGVDALPRTRSGNEGTRTPVPAPASYLPVVGAPALRFEEPPPAPESLPPRPAAIASTQPALNSAENSVATENTAAAQSLVAAVTEPESPASEAKPVTKEQPAPGKTPAPILPDDARPTIKPEDFLPYFQIPGSATKPGDVTLLMPASVMTTPAPQSAPVPASSATYTQTPK